MSSFTTSLAFTLSEEGGYVDIVDDVGGCTNKGIILATYRAFKGNGELTCDDLLAISDEDVAAIYRADYWDAIQADAMPECVALSVFDSGVNIGPNKAVELLQIAVGASIDGVVGYETLGCLRNSDPITVVVILAQLQLGYYTALDGFRTFGKGWSRRTARRLLAALDLA